MLAVDLFPLSVVSSVVRSCLNPASFGVSGRATPRMSAWISGGGVSAGGGDDGVLGRKQLGKEVSRQRVSAARWEFLSAVG